MRALVGGGPLAGGAFAHLRALREGLCARRDALFDDARAREAADEWRAFLGRIVL